MRTGPTHWRFWWGIFRKGRAGTVTARAAAESGPDPDPAPTRLSVGLWQYSVTEAAKAWIQGP